MMERFYILQVPHQSAPRLIYYERFQRFKIDWQFGWSQYQSKAELIAEAGWDTDEIPDEVRELPDGPIVEWSFGNQPSEYEVGTMNGDLLWRIVYQIANHDMHSGAVIPENEINDFEYRSHHQKEAVERLLRMERQEPS